jgi:hypothetical protein
MKSRCGNRIFIKGILSASIVAACLIAANGQQVYSANVCSYLNIPETNFNWMATIIWSDGPFTVGESHYWTDANGKKRLGSHSANDPVRSSTYFAVGFHTVTVPLSPRRTVYVGGMALLVIGTVLGALLLKKQRPA